MDKSKILSRAAMEKLLKKSGAERVSEDAKGVLADILEDYSVKIGEKAWQIARHSKRKTVKGSDVKIAAR